MTPSLMEGLPEALSSDDEQALALTLADEKTSEKEKAAIREKLVLHSMREAFFYARRCCRGGLSADEIYSLAYSALCRSIGNFKPDRIRYFSYSKVFIRGEISREWKNKSIIKNVPGDKMETTAALIPLEASKETGKHMAPVVHTVEPELDLIHARELWGVLSPLLESKLNSGERTVITLRYRQELNFREISALLGVTRQWAQRLHSEALAKLRMAMERNRTIL